VRRKKGGEAMSPHMFHQTAGYAEDLFGQPVTPHEERIPRRGSSGYLAHLHTLALPDGLKFWALAPDHASMGGPSFVESIWCTNGQLLLIDNRTGDPYAPEGEA
jgi:hypothetical protein